MVTTFTFERSVTENLVAAILIDRNDHQNDSVSLAESLFQMYFVCTCRTNKDQVSVGVNGIQRRQNFQTFHIFSPE